MLSGRIFIGSVYNILMLDKLMYCYIGLFVLSTPIPDIFVSCVTFRGKSDKTGFGRLIVSQGLDYVTQESDI